MTAPASIHPLAAFGILMGSGALAVLAADARISLVALAGQYVGAGLLLAAVTASGSLAWLQIAIGGLACVILYLGLRGQAASGAAETSPVSLPFRIMALTLAITAAVLLSLQWPLPYADSLTSLACYGLAALFVAQAGLFRAPARTGMAVLSLLIAAILFLQTTGGGLLLAAWAFAGHLLASLAAGYQQSGWNSALGEDL